MVDASRKTLVVYQILVVLQLTSGTTRRGVGARWIAATNERLSLESTVRKLLYSICRCRAWAILSSRCCNRAGFQQARIQQ
ncbi:hypothetical protein J3F84DRAFT_357354 [Trichoderma pleuroticola]